MKKVLLLKFGELFLKGKNRNEFKKLLKHNITKKLSGLEFKLGEEQGRLFVYDFDEDKLDEMVERLQCVFGLIALASATEIDTNLDDIKTFVSKIDFSDTKTFKVDVKRADKTFPVLSNELEKLLGGVVLENNPNLKVDLYNPERILRVEIRTNQKTYIYDKLLSCAGGLPLGSAGRGLLLLSGGIDSPVAGYLVSKRGLEIEAVHFHSYPYTSVQAKEKVIELAKQISKYCGKIKLHIVSFTNSQKL